MSVVVTSPSPADTPPNDDTTWKESNGSFDIIWYGTSLDAIATSWQIDFFRWVQGSGAGWEYLSTDYHTGSGTISSPITITANAGSSFTVAGDDYASSSPVYRVRVRSLATGNYDYGYFAIYDRSRFGFYNFPVTPPQLMQGQWYDITITRYPYSGSTSYNTVQTTYVELYNTSNPSGTTTQLHIFYNADPSIPALTKSIQMPTANVYGGLTTGWKLRYGDYSKKESGEYDKSFYYKYDPTFSPGSITMHPFMTVNMPTNISATASAGDTYNLSWTTTNITNAQTPFHVLYLKNSSGNKIYIDVIPNNLGGNYSYSYTIPASLSADNYKFYVETVVYNTLGNVTVSGETNTFSLSNELVEANTDTTSIASLIEMVVDAVNIQDSNQIKSSFSSDLGEQAFEKISKKDIVDVTDFIHNALNTIVENVDIKGSREESVIGSSDYSKSISVGVQESFLNYVSGMSNSTALQIASLPNANSLFSALSKDITGTSSVSSLVDTVIAKISLASEGVELKTTLEKEASIPVNKEEVSKADIASFARGLLSILVKASEDISVGSSIDPSLENSIASLRSSNAIIDDAVRSVIFIGSLIEDALSVSTSLITGLSVPLSKDSVSTSDIEDAFIEKLIVQALALENVQVKSDTEKSVPSTPSTAGRGFAGTSSDVDARLKVEASSKDSLQLDGGVEGLPLEPLNSTGLGFAGVSSSTSSVIKKPTVLEELVSMASALSQDISISPFVGSDAKTSLLSSVREILHVPEVLADDLSLSTSFSKDIPADVNSTGLGFAGVSSSTLAGINLPEANSDTVPLSSSVAKTSPLQPSSSTESTSSIVSLLRTSLAEAEVFSDAVSLSSALSESPSLPLNKSNTSKNSITDVLLSGIYKMSFALSALGVSNSLDKTLVDSEDIRRYNGTTLMDDIYASLAISKFSNTPLSINGNTSTSTALPVQLNRSEVTGILAYFGYRLNMNDINSPLAIKAMSLALLNELVQDKSGSVSVNSSAIAGIPYLYEASEPLIAKTSSIDNLTTNSENKDNLNKLNLLDATEVLWDSKYKNRFSSRVQGIFKWSEEVGGNTYIVEDKSYVDDLSGEVKLPLSNLSKVEEKRQVVLKKTTATSLNDNPLGEGGDVSNALTNLPEKVNSIMVEYVKEDGSAGNVYLTLNNTTLTRLKEGDTCLMPLGGDEHYNKGIAPSNIKLHADTYNTTNKAYLNLTIMGTQG